MAVVDREEFKIRFLSKMGDSDEDLTLIEDFTDTFMTGDGDTISVKEHEEKMAELEASWRKRYKERFSGAVKYEADKEEQEEQSKKTSYDDLFEEKEEES